MDRDDLVLMNKDIPVLYFSWIRDDLGEYFKEREWLRPDLKPLDYFELEPWLESRQASKHRDSINRLLRYLKCFELHRFLKRTHALTLNDTFWVKGQGTRYKWSDMSLYTNDFDEVLSCAAFEGWLPDPYYRTISPEFGTAGNYKKRWIREGNKIYLLKGSSSNALSLGLEPFCEELASQVSQIMCPKATHYDIVKYKENDVCKCELFTSEKLGFVPVGHLPDLYRVSDRSIFKYYDSLGFGEDYRRMVVLDALILNVDRHRGNYGFLFDNDTMEIVSAAPIFDNNLSLLFRASEEDLLHIDKYLTNLMPRIGNDFNRHANKYLTPEIKSDLKNLKGFEFDFSACPNFSDTRKRVLNEQLNKQINRILCNIRFYASPATKVAEGKEPSVFTDTLYYSVLKNSMPKEALAILCDIMDSRIKEEIVLNVSSVAIDKMHYSVEVLSPDYKLIGDGSLELVALKWFEGYEDMWDMVDVFKEYVKNQNSEEPNQPTANKMNLF